MTTLHYMSVNDDDIALFPYSTKYTIQLFRVYYR
jgi:hypothetical protein